MKPSHLIILAAVLAAPASAQAGSVPAPAQPQANGSAAVGASRAAWQMMTNNFIQAAEQTPESEYGFRPVETVRTFGQVVGHVAGAQYMICAAALGEAPRAESDIERTRTTKAELVQALRESTDYCGRAYAQTDAEAALPTQLFGRQQPRMFALNLNAAHNAEHYGNLVTYLRIRGRVPPSSQPRQ